MKSKIFQVWLVLLKVVLGLGDCDDSVCTSIPQDLDFMSGDEGMVEKANDISSISLSLLLPSRKTDMLPRFASCTGFLTDKLIFFNEDNGSNLAI